MSYNICPPKPESYSQGPCISHDQGQGWGPARGLVAMGICYEGLGFRFRRESKHERLDLAKA